MLRNFAPTSYVRIRRRLGKRLLLHGIRANVDTWGTFAWLFALIFLRFLRFLHFLHFIHGSFLFFFTVSQIDEHWLSICMPRSRHNARKWQAHSCIYLRCMQAAFRFQICVWPTSAQQIFAGHALLHCSRAAQRTGRNPASQHVNCDAANGERIPCSRYQILSMTELCKLWTYPVFLA